MYIRDISTYVSRISEENPQGTARVGVSLQSTAVPAKAGLFAIAPAKGTKIGYVSLKKGITLEQAQAELHIGDDLSTTFGWGEKKANEEGQKPNEFLYEVLLKGSTPDEPTA